MRRVICASADDQRVQGVPQPPQDLTRVLSSQIAAPLRDAQLSTVLDTWEPQVMPVSLVSAGQSAVPQKLRAFLDYAIQQLKQRLQDA